MSNELRQFAERIVSLMPEIIRGLIRQETNELARGKITLPQFFVLESLSKKGALCMTDIAHCMGFTTAAATGIVDRLVKCGYVQRVFAQEDRRVIRVKLTAKGLLITKNVCEERLKMVLKVFGKLSSEERKDYLKLLEKISKIICSVNDNGVKNGS